VYLQAAGFRVVDVSLQFEVNTADISGGEHGGVRAAKPADRDAVWDIAGRAFRYSRFHLDPYFPDEIAGRIKSEWVANWFSGKRGDALLVAEHEDRVVGFLLALVSHGKTVIDLIAVAPEQAGRGIGQALTRALKITPVGSNVQPVIAVGTQAANIPAARFYEKLGFRLAGVGYVLHHHGNEPMYMKAKT